MQIKLVNAGVYFVYGRKYEKGNVYDVAEDTAARLLELRDDKDRLYFLEADADISAANVPSQTSTEGGDETGDEDTENAGGEGNGEGGEDEGDDDPDNVLGKKPDAPAAPSRRSKKAASASDKAVDAI